MGRAEVAQAEVRLAGDSFEQRRAEARLADAGLAREQDDAACAGLRLLPAAQQQLEFFVAAQQRRDARLVQGLEAVFRRAEARDLPRLHGLGEALECCHAEIAVIEQAAGEAARDGLDHHRVRFGQHLQAGGEAGRAADNAVLRRLVRAGDIAHDDQSGGDADADLRRDLRGPVALAQPLHQRQAGAGGALGGVLVRLRITEINQHAVAHETGDEAAEAADGFSRICLVGDHHLAQVLRIEAHRERRRADEVAEHDRELAPLGHGRRRHDGRRRGRAGYRRAAPGADLAAVRDVGLAVRTNHTPPLYARPTHGTAD